MEVRRLVGGDFSLGETRALGSCKGRVPAKLGVPVRVGVEGSAP